MITIAPEVSDLTKNSILLVLRLRKPGNRRKVSSGLVEVDADREAISVGKELLESDELQAVVSFDGTIRRFLYARSLPAYGVLKDGAYRLPNTLIEEVDEALLAFKATRLSLIEEFIAVYPYKVEAAKLRLRILYDPDDYPDVQHIRDAFGFDYRYMTFGIPGSIGSALLGREMEKARADIASETEEIKLALRASFAGLVEHAAERLAPSTDGKRRVFRDTVVKNLEDFFRYFADRNIVGDNQLAGLVAQARTVLNGVDPNDLRNNDDLRGYVQRTMAGIKQTMDEGQMLRPVRKFTLLPQEEAPHADPVAA